MDDSDQSVHVDAAHTMTMHYGEQHPAERPAVNRTEGNSTSSIMTGWKGMQTDRQRLLASFIWPSSKCIADHMSKSGLYCWLMSCTGLTLRKDRSWPQTSLKNAHLPCSGPFSFALVPEGLLGMLVHACGRQSPLLGRWWLNGGVCCTCAASRLASNISCLCIAGTWLRQVYSCCCCTHHCKQAGSVKLTGRAMLTSSYKS